MAEHVEMAEHRVVILVIPCDCRLPFVVALVVLELPVSRAVLFQSLVKIEEVFPRHVDIDVVIPRNKAAVARCTDDRAACAVIRDAVLAAEGIDLFEQI